MLAYERTHGICATNCYFSDENFNLLDPRDIERILNALAEINFTPNLIVLDTLARLIPGADENKAQDMSAAIAAIEKLKRAYSATILVVHHTDKHGDSGRGSSALRGAVDVMIKCKAKSERSLSLACNKMKDAEAFQPAAIGLELVQFSASESSLAVANLRHDAKDEAGQGDVALARHVNAALQVLAQFGSSGATYTKWQEAFNASTGHSKKTFDRARKEIESDGRAVYRDGKRYYARQANEGVKCQEVSKECHDTSHVGVTSPPSLGGDTDTAAIGQK